MYYFLVLLFTIPFFASALGNDFELVQDNSKDICNALSKYKLVNRHYPTTQDGLFVLTYPSENDYGESGEPYIRNIENDPWGNEYIYKQDGTKFILTSKGQDGVLGTEDDINQNTCYYKRK